MYLRKKISQFAHYNIFVAIDSVMDTTKFIIESTENKWDMKSFSKLSDLLNYLGVSHI